MIPWTETVETIEFHNADYYNDSDPDCIISLKVRENEDLFYWIGNIYLPENANVGPLMYQMTRTVLENHKTFSGRGQKPTAELAPQAGETWPEEQLAKLKEAEHDKTRQ